MSNEASSMWETQLFGGAMEKENFVDLEWIIARAQNTGECKEIDPSEFERIQKEHDEAMAHKTKGNK